LSHINDSIQLHQQDEKRMCNYKHNFKPEKLTMLYVLVTVTEQSNIAYFLLISKVL
jgi:hypothetical protein